MGLRQLLTTVIPSGTIVAFANAAELKADNPECFFHFFVDIGELLADRQFFQEWRHRTIVLVTNSEQQSSLADFHCLCVTVPEKQLIRSLLMIQQKGHPQGKNIPKAKSILTPREVEVLALVARGLINKEIADRLNISLTTVITHRKNITEKLGVRSVSALTIYAVMNGYVNLEQI
jgi:DNA-binding CsgD family transcriptional regulator